MNGFVPYQPVVGFFCYTDRRFHLAPCKCKTCPWTPETVFRTWFRGMMLMQNWN